MVYDLHDGKDLLTLKKKKKTFKANFERRHFLVVELAFRFQNIFSRVQSTSLSLGRDSSLCQLSKSRRDYGKRAKLKLQAESVEKSLSLVSVGSCSMLSSQGQSELFDLN